MSRKRITASESSTTLRLPQEILDRLGIDDGDEVDVSIVDHALFLRPLDEAEQGKLVVEPEYTLEELLAKVTKQNLHEEIDTGIACGKEAW